MAFLLEVGPGGSWWIVELSGVLCSDCDWAYGLVGGLIVSWPCDGEVWSLLVDVLADLRFARSFCCASWFCGGYCYC